MHCNFNGVLWGRILIIPSTGVSSSFRQEEFMEDGFSVDDFVARHRARVSLEVLRKDLGQVKPVEFATIL